jgi:hypothetical protein
MTSHRLAPGLPSACHNEPLVACESISVLPIGQRASGSAQRAAGRERGQRGHQSPPAAGTAVGSALRSGRRSSREEPGPVETHPVPHERQHAAWDLELSEPLPCRQPQHPGRFVQLARLADQGTVKVKANVMFHAWLSPGTRHRHRLWWLRRAFRLRRHHRGHPQAGRPPRIAR